MARRSGTCCSASSSLPGGTAERAKSARKRLDSLGGDAQKGLFGSLARAIDDEMHGHFRAGATAHLDAIVAARTSPLPDASLIAWYAANHLLNLRAGFADLWAHCAAGRAIYPRSPGPDRVARPR